jgi:DNA mismatch endonuclease (patch repair protein)
MPDVFSKQERSYVMSTIRSSGNRSTELRLVVLMKREGITGWRRRYRLTGKPDFVFSKERLVIFVDGCFWHGCPRCRNIPATNKAYWVEKNERNRARDQLITRRLRDKGWTVLRIWEHSLRIPQRVSNMIQRALAASRESRRMGSRPAGRKLRPVAVTNRQKLQNCVACR